MNIIDLLTNNMWLFMVHLLWAALGWGVILQFVFQRVLGWFGYAPPAIPAGGVANPIHIVWRMPAGIEWFTEIFFMVNAIGSIFMYMSDPTYSALHGLAWDSYAVAVVIILIVGISCELFPWLEQRTNHITANIGVNLCIGILFALLFH